MSKEAMKLALEALEAIAIQGDLACVVTPDGVFYLQPAITALREALAEQPAPVQQCMDHGECFGGKCIYPAPQPAQQQQQEARIAQLEAELMRMQGRELKLQFALAQQQEPWGACISGRVFVGGLPEHARKLAEDEGLPIQWLYTRPQAREPLTLREIEREWQFLHDEEGNQPDHHDFARAIEAAHGIKENT